MKKKLIPLLAIALVVAVLSTAIFYGLVSTRLEPPSAAQAATGRLVVAARAVERGKALEASDVKVVEGLCPNGPNQCLQAAETAIGRVTSSALVDGQPVSEASLIRRNTNALPSAVIPAGQRAVTLHIAESSGVMNLLRPTDRVDIQVIGSRDPGSNGLIELRTLIQNVEVLEVSPAETGNNSPMLNRPVVTVLVAPEEADRLSLADAAGRVRLVLRNHEDQKAGGAGKTLPFYSLFGGAPAAQAAPRAAPSPGPVAPVALNAAPVASAPESAVQFEVRLASVDPAALREWTGPEDSSFLQVKPLAAGLEQQLDSLREKKQFELLSSSQLHAYTRSEVSFQADARDRAALKIRLTPKAAAAHGLRLRVEPEVTQPSGDTVSVRRLETELGLANGQTFLVAGLLEKPNRHLAAKLFSLPRPADVNRPFVVLVTPALAR
jgi:pilus assembly protein CpaB